MILKPVLLFRGFLNQAAEHKLWQDSFGLWLYCCHITISEAGLKDVLSLCDTPLRLLKDERAAADKTVARV